MCHVYILICSDNSYYVGLASNLEKRLLDHQKGRVRYTSSRLPSSLVYIEEFSTLSEARRRESQIKSWKKRRDIERLIKK